MHMMPRWSVLLSSRTVADCSPALPMRNCCCLSTRKGNTRTMQVVAPQEFHFRGCPGACLHQAGQRSVPESGLPVGFGAELGGFDGNHCLAALSQPHAPGQVPSSHQKIQCACTPTGLKGLVKLQDCGIHLTCRPLMFITRADRATNGFAELQTEQQTYVVTCLTQGGLGGTPKHGLHRGSGDSLSRS